MSTHPAPAQGSCETWCSRAVHTLAPLVKPLHHTSCLLHPVRCPCPTDPEEQVPPQSFLYCPTALVSQAPPGISSTWPQGPPRSLPLFALMASLGLPLPHALLMPHLTAASLCIQLCPSAGGIAGPYGRSPGLEEPSLGKSSVPSLPLGHCWALWVL